jgi:hypothetical protein
MAKTLSPKQLRKINQQMAADMEALNNGAPIPGEIAARMTKDQEDELFQIWVEPKGQSHAVPLGPMMRKLSCEKVLEAVNRQIAQGKDALFGNPHIVACKIISSPKGYSL